MLRQFRKTGLIIGVCLMIAGLGGCGGSETITEVETTKPEEIYKSVIEELKSSKLADQFELVNIDEDDVPELVASDSTGSYDHDNAFIYTVSNGEAVLIASAVSGVDGISLCYSEGKNLIRKSEGIAGASDVFSKIKDGRLEEVFRAEMIDTLEADANDEEIYTYSVNGKDTDKTEYVEEYTKFIEPYDPLISIDYDGLNRIKYVHDRDMVWFEQEEQGNTKKYTFSMY